jgi:phenylpropionate dioxygenase-like ring-hydroxylating dioxygenase large terminal subunit
MQGKCYALPDERPQMQRARELNQAINTGVGNEDIQLIEWVAEGMRSSAFDGLMLSDIELGVASFHNACAMYCRCWSWRRRPSREH